MTSILTRNSNATMTANLARHIRHGVPVRVVYWPDGSVAWWSPASKGAPLYQGVEMTGHVHTVEVTR